MLVQSTLAEKDRKARLARIQCWLLDMDGTTTIGEELLPGADRFFQAISKQQFLFVTNNSSHSAAHYVQRMNRAGIPTERRNVLTSTDALIHFLKVFFQRSATVCSSDSSIPPVSLKPSDSLKPFDSPRPSNQSISSVFSEDKDRLDLLKDKLQSNAGEKMQIRVFPVGTPDFENELTEAGLHVTKTRGESIDAVLLAFDTTLTYEKLEIACDYIRAGIPYFAANPDRVCPLADGKVLPDCGAIIAFMETCTGKSPVRVIGKPDMAMARMILTDRGYQADELAMVGDRTYTDLLFAKNAGILGIAVLSGEASLDEIRASGIDPEFVFDGIGDLAEYLL